MTTNIRHHFITNGDTAIVEPVVVVPVEDAVYGGAAVILDPAQSLHLLPGIITLSLSLTTCHHLPEHLLGVETVSYNPATPHDSDQPQSGHGYAH